MLLSPPSSGVPLSLLYAWFVMVVPYSYEDDWNGAHHDAMRRRRKRRSLLPWLAEDEGPAWVVVECALPDCGHDSNGASHAADLVSCHDDSHSHDSGTNGREEADAANEVLDQDGPPNC